MPILRRPGPLTLHLLVPAVLLAVILAGCIFDDDNFIPERRYDTGLLDTLLPSGVAPDRVVELYHPLRDPSLEGKPPAAPVTSPAVNVRDHATGKVIQYRLTRQRHGTWTPELEFRWNWFLLQVSFIFPEGLPDTAGMAGKTKSLYDAVHRTDAFTNYYDSAAAPAALGRISSTSKPGALGVEVSLNDSEDTVIIRHVAPGSPADRAGLVGNQAILAVDDSSVTGDSAIDRFSRFVAGDSGEPAILRVMPRSGAARDVHLVRMPVEFPTVYVDSLGGVGYIAVTGFMPQTAGGKNTQTEFKAALLATRGFAKTVIDLRDNGGGSLDLTMRMCDEILPAGAVIIRQHQRRFSEEDRVPLLSQASHLATTAGVAEKRKFVLLANGRSASAAEIFVAALREGAGAPLVGARTYGKGVGQTVQETPGRGLSLVTFLRFTTKENLDYHRKGIEPDYPDTAGYDSQLLKAVSVAKGLAQAGAKRSAAEAALQGALGPRARAVEWNRRQRARPGVREVEAPLLP